MKLAFHDIIAKVIAAQRFPALALLVGAQKCHEMCGCVTFYEIFDVRFCYPESGHSADGSAYALRVKRHSEPPRDLRAHRLLSNLTDDAHRILNMRQEKLVNLSGRSRSTNQIALYVRAAEHSSMLALLRCLDALSDDPHVKVSRQIGYGANNGAGFSLVRQTCNEATVDLDLAERETHQVAERGVTRAKIVHRKLHAVFV